MDNLQQPNHSHPPPQKKPSPYDQQEQLSINPYAPKRRPLPPDSPIQSQQPAPSRQSISSDPYSSAFELLQAHRPSGSFYPEAHMSEPRPSPAKSPDIVSPLPQRLTPSMPANLAQNLDQQSKSANSWYGSEPPSLPPIDVSETQYSEESPSNLSLASSKYSQPSGLEDYLTSDKFSSINQGAPTTQQTTSEPARGGPYSTYPSSRGPQPPRTDPYTTNAAARSDPYSTYVPPSSEPFSPPQAPFSEQARPGSSQGKAVPQPPRMVDYSRAPDFSDSSSRGRQSYVPPQDEFKYPQQPARGRSPQPAASRPFSQDMTNAPYQSAAKAHRSSGTYPQPSMNADYSVRPQSQDLSYAPGQDTSRPHRGPGTYDQPAPRPDFIDMPEGLVQPFNDFNINDPLPGPVRLSDSPGRQSPRIPASTSSTVVTSASIASPPSVVPQSEYEWENEIDSQRETAQRTADPNIALTWAEKVYMQVSIKLEELRRDLEISASDGGINARAPTPPYERGLREDCVRIVEKFAKLQIPKAVYMRGIWFDYGDFKYPNERQEAYRAYTLAAKLGYARADYRLGKMYEDVGEMKRALHHYDKGVSQGDSAALYRMGMLHLCGQKGFAINIPEGVRLLSQSAAKADLDAPQGAYVFALLLAGEFSGASVPESILPRDERGARRMLEKASSLGFSHAMLKLGNAYENGTWGCGYDPTLSVHYYTLAAKHGDLEAMMGLSKWYLCGGEGFNMSEEKAYINAERAAKGGLPQAEFAMGYFYEVGIYVSPNLALAESWYARAAEHGNKDAIQRQQGLSRKQTLSRKDHEDITSNIRSSRLKKGQKAPPPQAVPEQRSEPIRPMSGYQADPNGRSQSPAGRRYPSASPAQPDQRRSSSGGPRPRPDYSRHSSYASYNAPEYSQEFRKSSYGPGSSVNQSVSQPSVASLANAPDDGYRYSPPVRPTTGSRPVSQGSIGGFPQQSSQPNIASADHVFGSGPKTFQEMGVQTSHKKDGDCLIM